MDLESINYNRHRWNRSLVNIFWILLLLSVAMECLYLTITEESAADFIKYYIVRPTLLQLAVLLLTEAALRTTDKQYMDYIIISSSTLFASILVFVHVTIDYLIIGLFFPVLVSVYYFSGRKLLYAYCNTLASLYCFYFFGSTLRENITVVGLLTITILFSSFALISMGILLRGKELMRHLVQSYESNQELVVKTMVMDRLASTDGLTELYNHRIFQDKLGKMIEGCEQKQGEQSSCLHLALLDIDNFKQINDECGHSAGDEVLKSVANILRKLAYNNGNYAFRYGGEEFALLFSSRTREDVVQTMEQIRIEVSKLKHPMLKDTSVTISAGIGEYHPGEGKHPFFIRIDEALYTAKKNGKNRILFADAANLIKIAE